MTNVVPFPTSPDRPVRPPAPLCRVVPDALSAALDKQRGRIEGRYVRHRTRALYGKARNLRGVSGVVMAELWDACPARPTGTSYVLIEAEALDLCPPALWPAGVR